MSDAEIDEEVGLVATGGAEPAKGGGGGSDGGAPGRSPYRAPALALARAVVVLVIAAVGYQEVIPHPVVVRSRLAQLVIQHPGVPGYKAKPSSKGEQSASNVGVAALSAAAKKSPDRTGLYSIGWPSTTKGSSDVVGVIAFLLPDPAQAETVLQQVDKTLLSANAQSATSLVRAHTFTVPGVAGSAGSLFEPKKKTKTSQDVALTSFRRDNVVAVAEIVKTTGTAAGAPGVERLAGSLTTAEHRHLQPLVPGFTLTVTRHPTVASTVWIAGSVAAALLAALGPVAFGWARRRRQARLQAELDRLIVVRGQTITKRRL